MSNFIGPQVPEDNSMQGDEDEEIDQETQRQMNCVALNEQIVIKKMMKDLNKASKFISDTNWMFKNGNNPQNINNNDTFMLS